MRRLINVGSIAGIVLGVVLVAYALSSSPSQASSVSLTFADFPLNQPRIMTVSVREDALEDLSPREHLDQVRDWLLYAVVSASGLSAADVNQALFDVPPVRHGYLQAIASFEYGVTRSANLGNGQIIALVPAGSSERQDQLA